MFEQATVTITAKRYSELAAKEERLRLLENALRTRSGYTDIEGVKTIFELQEKGNQE